MRNKRCAQVAQLQANGTHPLAKILSHAQEEIRIKNIYAAKYCFSTVNIVWVPSFTYYHKTFYFIISW